MNVMLPNVSRAKLYTLQKDKTLLKVFHRQREYFVGFNNLTHARKVHYSINMNPQLLLLRDTNIDLYKDLHNEGYDMHLTIDVRSTLFIPKNVHSCIDSVYDSMYTMSQVDEHEFLQVPLTTKNGIIVPYTLIDETDEEFMFTSYVVDPVDIA